MKKNYNVFNVHQKNDLCNHSKLDAIVEKAIGNGAHILDQGKDYVLMGFDGTLNAFRRATGRTNAAYIVLEEQPVADHSEIGGSE